MRCSANVVRKDELGIISSEWLLKIAQSWGAYRYDCVTVMASVT
jgi:hypothetical protein